MPSEYVVFRHIDGLASDKGEAAREHGAWTEIGRASAATPKAAIKLATDGKLAAERTGTFVAVPVRSFQPVTRRVQSVEKDEWS